MRMRLVFLLCGTLAVAAAPAVLPPLDVRDLDMAKAPPAWAALLRQLERPADRVVLTDGRELVAEPLSAPLRAGAEDDTVVLRPIGGGEPQKVRAADVQKVHRFEDRFLDDLGKQLGGTAPTRPDLELAEKALRVALRWHRSLRCPPPLGTNPWGDVESRLEDRLLEVRRQLLQLLARQGEMSEALALGELWRPLYPVGSPLRDEIRDVWARHVEALAKAGDYKQARAQLDRIEREFVHSPQADAARSALRSRAEALASEAKDMPGAQALRQLQDALMLWPRLPGARDELERRRQTYQVLRIAVRTLPEAISPATAWTDIEKQATELIFESLVTSREDPALGNTYRLALAERFPEDGTHPQARLRRDLYWADGTRLTSADLRHTLLLAQQAGGEAGNPAARELLKAPHFEGNLFRLELAYRQGTLDPLAPLTFKVLPQQYRGKPLPRADDTDFAREPLGSGPYQYAGRKQEGEVPVALFRANPCYVRAGEPEPGSIREVHLRAWRDRLAELGTPLPHLVWDPPTDQLAGLRRQGYSEVRTLPTPRVYFLAVNHRRAALAGDAVRRALAHAIDREKLLDQFFRAPGGTEAPPHHAANGLFPRGCWAAASATRVPPQFYQPEQALALLKQVKGDLDFTLKYPDDDPRVAKACTELAKQVEQRFAEGGVRLTLRPLPLPPRELRRALEQREYDLLYQSIEHGDEPYRLWALFDPQESAVRPGGSNYLGYESDAKLQKLLRAALQHREFAELRDNLQTAHAHLAQMMPVIPLWQLDTHVAVHASLRLPELEALALFADVVRWKLGP